MTATRTRRITGRRLKYTAPWLSITQTFSSGPPSRTTYHVAAVPSLTGWVFDLTRADDAAPDGIRIYRISLYRNGGASCMQEDGSPCPAFGYRQGQRCKHTDAVRKVLSLETPAPVAPRIDR